MKRYTPIDFMNDISRMKAEITGQLLTVENEKNLIEQQYTIVNNELASIKNGTIWKVAEPLRKARNLLK